MGPAANARKVYVFGNAEVPQDERTLEVARRLRGTVHDFDLAFQPKDLDKIGHLGKVCVVGLPEEGKVDYPRVRSILRKLVAQDIQGS